MFRKLHISPAVVLACIAGAGYIAANPRDPAAYQHAAELIALAAAPGVKRRERAAKPKGA